MVDLADVSDFLQNDKRSPLTFLFHDAGDKIFSIRGAGLSALQFDTIDDEVHIWNTDVTQFPTEGLEDIGDNIKPKPEELNITAFISNAPIRGLIDEVTHFADRFLDGTNRLQTAFNQLKALRDKRSPVAVITRYRVYEGMGLTSVQIRRSPDGGASFVVDLSFRKINIVTAQTGRVPAGIGKPGAQSDNATKTRAGSKVDAGKSTGKSVTNPADAPKPVQRQRSTLSVLLSGK